MASLSIPYSDFVAGTTIVSDQVDQNNAAIVNYINARNAASANWDAVSTVGAFTSTLTTNQIILGTTRTVTLTAPTPATLSRVITLPDLTGDYSVVGTIGTQSIAGAKTFTQTISVTQSTSGNPTGATFSNTSNTAASDARLAMVIAGTSGGDAYVDLVISGGREWVFGCDNSDDDSIVLSKAGSPGTNNAFRVDGTSSALSFRGTATNDNAAAGFVGEFIEASQTSFLNAAATNTQGDLTSISLTAGDWDVSFAGQWTSNGATWTLVEMSFGTTSGNTAGLLASRQQDTWASTSTVVLDRSFSGSYRLSLSATTTTYLKYKSLFSAGTPQAIGRLSARRVR